MRKLFGLLLLACLGCGSAAPAPPAPGAASAPRDGRLHQAIGVLLGVPEAFVNTLAPRPRGIDVDGGSAERPGAASALCLSPERAYDLALARELRSGPRHRWAGARDGIEGFARAIGPIASARHAARAAAARCVTESSIEPAVRARAVAHDAPLVP